MVANAEVIIQRTTNRKTDLTDALFQARTGISIIAGFRETTRVGLDPKTAVGRVGKVVDMPLDEEGYYVVQIVHGSQRRLAKKFGLSIEQTRASLRSAHALMLDTENFSIMPTRLPIQGEG